MLVSGVCVVLASPALQMGGGAWAWIWGAAAAAGIARGLAFAAAAVAPSFPMMLVLEQALLWTFACGWLLATSLHLRLVTRR
jgi:thiosulfate reductase cytochrome b subunit